MPSLIDLRRRVRAVKNTQQITKAMKMVAASKLRRAQERIMGARPYAVQMQRVLAQPGRRASIRRSTRCSTRASRRPDSRTLVIVVTGDKGLCGSFNTNVIKGAGAVHRRRARSPARSAWSAARAATSSAAAASTVLFEQVGHLPEAALRGRAGDRADGDRRRSRPRQVDRVVLVYNEFKSVMTQRVVVDQLLPIAAGRRRGAAAPAAPRPASRRSTTCTSRRRRRSSTSCCRATSRCRSTARCSSRTRHSSPRR